MRRLRILNRNDAKEGEMGQNTGGGTEASIWRTAWATPHAPDGQLGAESARGDEYSVRRLGEGDRREAAALLRRDPGFGLFPLSNLDHMNLASSFTRYWGAFADNRLRAILMMVGARAALYAPPDVDVAPLTRIAAHDELDFTMGRTDLVDALLAACPQYRLDRREEHYLAELTHERRPRVHVPQGAIVRRAQLYDVEPLTQLYFGSDGFEHLREDELRRTIAGRVRSARTYVAQVSTRLVSAASTSGETTISAMIGGVWTAPDARNRGYSTAVVAALSRELLEQRRTPYLFYLMDNAPAAAVYARVGFRVVGRWSVAYLSPRLPA